MAKITDSELLLVSKATQEKLKNFSHGAELSARAKISIAALQVRVANDRLKLARRHLAEAKKTLGLEPSAVRSVVSRAYYAMYHAARAVTYISYGGDDHEQHSVLPGKLPQDFPDVENWKNRLKDARYERNRADYDPYPKSDSGFRDVANNLLIEAKEFIVQAQKYIEGKAK